MPDNDQPAPSAFREMTDAFTDGCGCACHTGAGYNSSCDHCTADPSPSTVDEALPLLTIAEARAFLYRVISDYLEEGDYLPGEEPLVAVAEFEAAVRREEQQAAADLHDGTMRGYEYEVLAHTRTKAALASALTRAEEAEVALHSCSCEPAVPNDDCPYHGALVRRAEQAEARATELERELVFVARTKHPIRLGPVSAALAGALTERDEQLAAAEARVQGLLVAMEEIVVETNVALPRRDTAASITPAEVANRLARAAIAAAPGDAAPREGAADAADRAEAPIA